MKRSEAIDTVKLYWPIDEGGPVLREAIETLIPELKESEDERIKKEIISYIKSSSAVTNPNWIAWLKKQGSQNLANSEKTCKVEQNPAWSEEDEEMFDFAIRAISLCRQYAINHQVKGYSKLPDIPKRYEELRDWFKSLKERYTWKPSEEQIIALKKACDEHWEPDGLDPLYTLYQDLKKLKG